MPLSEHAARRKAGNEGVDAQRERAKVSVDTSVICLIKASNVVRYLSGVLVVLDAIAFIIDGTRE